MTTTTARTTRTGAARATATLPRVIAAEWTKAVGLRSSLWVPLGTVLAAAGLAFVLGMFVRPGDGRSAATLVVSGAVLAQLGPLVLGVLAGTAEHTTGTFRSTFTAVPRRWPVLAAQTLVTLAVAVATALAALLASWLATAGARATAGLPLDVTDGETARVLTGFVLHQAGLALLGLGLGSLVRRPTAALVAAVLLVVVLDQVLATNPGQAADTARTLLPGAGTRLMLDDAHLASADATSLGPSLGAWGGGLVLGSWAVALLAAAGHRLRRHDLS
jgi:ABC-2 type transport system permease protein